MSKSFSAKGFTLLEVLIAISIFAMISMASFTIFNTVITGNDTSKVHSERLYRLQKTWMIIERDLIQLATRTVRINGEAPLKGYLHTEQSGLDTTIETLGFVRTGWRNPGLLLPRSDMQSVAYRLNESTFERLHYNFVDAVVGEEPKVRPLLQGVKSITFEFYYDEKWQQEAPKKGLPKAIAITLELEDFGNVKRSFLIPEGNDIAPAQQGNNNG